MPTPDAAHPAPAGLDAIMAHMRTFGCEFTGTFANHAPMVLVALDRIGGSPERLSDFFAAYNADKGLLPAPTPVASLDARTWPDAIGDRTREADLIAFFAGEVAALGREAALRRHLPRLAPGIGASAFHALMRTAYGLLLESDAEVATALGYWAATYLAMPPSTGAAPLTREPAEVLARVAALPEIHDLPLHPLLWQNMRENGRCPAFAPVVDWLAIEEGTMARMAGAAIALFTATQDFCALHAVTGLHWIRIVAPNTDATPVMLRHFWQGVAGLMGEMRFPVLPDAARLDAWRALPVPTWEEIEAKAATSYDEHDISITFSAREEMKVYGDPLYQLAAARRVGLVPAYADGV